MSEIDVEKEVLVSARHDPNQLARELFDQGRAQELASGHWCDLSMVGPIPINVAVKAVIQANTQFVRLGKILCIVPTRRVVKREAGSSDDGYAESNVIVFRLFLHEVKV